MIVYVSMRCWQLVTTRALCTHTYTCVDFCFNSESICYSIRLVICKIGSTLSWKSMHLLLFSLFFLSFIVWSISTRFPIFSSIWFYGLIYLQLLKPAFTIIRDTQSKCLLLLIRGTHSIKDTLTAATGAVVPFHHSVLNDGGISNLVLGYAHCGMVAAARWIAKLCTPTLLKALGECPDFKVKVLFYYF